MAENSWKAPAAIIGIVTALVAIGGLYYQHKETELKQRERDLQEVVERDKIRLQDGKERQKQDRIKELKGKIDEIGNQIQTCNENIRRAEIEKYVTAPKQFDTKLTQPERAEYHSRFEAAVAYEEENFRAIDDLDKKKEELEKEINALVSNVE